MLHRFSYKDRKIGMIRTCELFLINHEWARIVNFTQYSVCFVFDSH